MVQRSLATAALLALASCTLEVPVTVSVDVVVNQFPGSADPTTVTVTIDGTTTTYDNQAAASTLSFPGIEVGTVVAATVTTEGAVSQVDIKVNNRFCETVRCEEDGCTASASLAVSDVPCDETI